MPVTVVGCHSPYLPLWYVDDHGAHLIGWRGGWHCGDLTGQRSSPKSYSLLSGCYEDTGSMSCEKPRWTFSLASVLGRAWAAACPGLAVSAERARRVAQQRLTVEPGACGRGWLSSRGVAERRGLSFGSECSLQPRAAQGPLLWVLPSEKGWLPRRGRSSPQPCTAQLSRTAASTLLAGLTLGLTCSSGLISLWLASSYHCYITFYVSFRAASNPFWFLSQAG